MRIIAGLGNPGKKYANTPHNVGFEVIDELARRCGCRLRGSLRTPVMTGTAVLGGVETLLVKPETFMNLSGMAIGQVMRRKGLSAADLVVVLDDADLETGRLRVRALGSSGGHKGLQSIVDVIGNGDFCRVRLGIGRGTAGKNLVDHVLGSFTAADRAVMKSVVAAAADAVTVILESGVEKAMNEYNARVYERARSDA